MAALQRLYSVAQTPHQLVTLPLEASSSEKDKNLSWCIVRFLVQSKDVILQNMDDERVRFSMSQLRQKYLALNPSLTKSSIFTSFFNPPNAVEERSARHYSRYVVVRECIGTVFDREGNVLEDMNLTAPDFPVMVSQYIAEGFIPPKRELLLAERQIYSIPPLIIQLFTGLTLIDLRSNRLEEIPEAIGLLPQLKELRLSDNPLRGLPCSIRRLSKTDIDFSLWKFSEDRLSLVWKEEERK